MVSRTKGTKKESPKKKRFVPTVRQYNEDLEALRAAGPNAVLSAVLGGQPKVTERRKRRVKS